MKNKKTITRKKAPKIGSLIEFLQKEMADLAIDSAKFDGGNNTAGVRVRIKLQDITYQIKEVRQEILIRKKKREEKRRKEKK